MTKIQHKKSIYKEKNDAKKSIEKIDFLDKLEQLSFFHSETTKKTLRNRAKSKHFTNIYVKKLASLKSPLQKAYNNTIYGCSEVLVQKGNKLTSTYCGYRWCTTCNRIRTAKQIKGYMKPIKALKEPYFITLTIPNVKGEVLRESIKDMTRVFTNIRKNLHSKSIKLVGIRKLESTYNPKRNDYHPHFHCIIENKKIAETLIIEWLKRYPNAKRVSQDIRPADDGSILELFKYFTKIITKRSIYVEPLDVIFQAMKSLQVYRPFGIKKVSEEIDETVSQQIKDLAENDTLWKWIESDWVDEQSGELLTNYIPDEVIKELTKSVL